MLSKKILIVGEQDLLVFTWQKCLKKNNVYSLSKSRPKKFGFK